MNSGITSGRVLNGELLYTKILEVNLFAFAYRLGLLSTSIYFIPYPRAGQPILPLPLSDGHPHSKPIKRNFGYYIHAKFYILKFIIV